MYLLPRERKWKLAQAKKFVRKAAASESNLALRDGVREREEAIKIRKRAAWIGKEVGFISRPRSQGVVSLWPSSVRSCSVLYE